MSRVSRKSYRKHQSQGLSRQRHRNGAKGTAACGLGQPEHAHPLTRRGWAACGVLRGFVALDKGCGTSYFSQHCRPPLSLMQGGPGLRPTGLSACSSLLWRENCSSLLLVIVSWLPFSLRLCCWPGFLCDRPEVLIYLKIKRFWGELFLT